MKAAPQLGLIVPTAPASTDFPGARACDYCGIADELTQSTMLFANDPGDGWHWLHPGCMRGFYPVRAEPVFRKGKFIGAIVEIDGRWHAYLYHSRTEGMLRGIADTAAAAEGLIYAPLHL